MSVIVLAAILATIGFEQHSPAANVVASGVHPPVVTPVTHILPTGVTLPAMKNIYLPPIPQRKAGIKDPFIAANYVYLLDEASSMALYEKNALTPVAIASTTKIATAVVALQHFPDLDQSITISKEAANQIGSAVGYRVGETATIRQLLYGLLIVSGNDAAFAIAEQLSKPGDESKISRFVDEMNQLARTLSLDNTIFADPAGLNDIEGRSTAAEMAKLLSYGLKTYPIISEMMSKPVYSYRSAEGYQHDFKNSNRLVTDEMRYEGIIGGKTGYTPKLVEGGAGHCLIVAAKRNGHMLIAAILDTHAQTPQASAEVARSLLNYGFSSFNWEKIIR